MAYINNSGQVRIGVRGWVAAQSGASVTDSDATAFVTAAGITDSTQISALNTLVTDLKTYGLWTKMKALYPFVGGSAASHKFNLKDPRDLDAAYRLVFNGGWTHTSNGAKPNGTTGYADTKLTPSVNISNVNSVSISNYSRTQDTSFNGVQIGCYDGSNGQANELNAYQYYSIISRKGGSSYQYSIEAVLSTETNTKGFLLNSRTSSSIFKLFFNNNLLNTNTTIRTGNLPTRSLYIGASNWFNGTNQYTPHEHAFDSIGDGLTDTEAANFYISVQKFQTTLGRHVGTPYVSDPDAIAFLMAAGITDGTQAAAINTLVIRMKADGVWTKMKAIYPFVGGSAASHKFNLKDPRDLDAAFRLVFIGGWTHTSNGAKGNGTTGYADTKLIPSSNYPTSYDMAFGFYSRTDIIENSNDISAYNTSSQCIGIDTRWSDGKIYGYIYRDAVPYNIVVPNSSSAGLISLTRTSTTMMKIFRDTSILGTTTTLMSGTVPTTSIKISGSAAGSYSTREKSFIYIGNGLSDAEINSLYSAVQSFQTTLGRQVNVPLVSDTDAQSFLNAANITSFQQASAVNKLVVDLKAAGVWTKMKAIYPFVGGSAASHKWNLKDPRDLDAAFRLVFNGGWTHTSTGALPNGTTGYADTKMNANSTNFDYQSMSATFYSRTNNSLGVNDIGVQTGSNRRFIELNIKEGNLSYMALSHQGISYLNFTNNDSRGFYHSNRIDSNTIKLYKNGSNVATGTQTSTNIYGEYSVYISALNARHNNNQVLYFSNREVSFTTLGSGLTDAEATSLYNAVQTYQTSLGRAVDTPVYNNGLVLNLDAGNANSYPGTGTTWFDLASGNNGTLVNGPTYDATSGGSILFDGVNDYVDLGSNFKFNDTDITYDFWFKVTDNSDVYHEIITLGSSNQSNALSLWKFRSGSNSGKVFINICVSGFTQTIATSQLTGADILNTIVNYTAVFKKESGVYKLYLYRNGVLDATNTSNITSYNMNNWSNFEARIGSGSTLFPELWKGNIYSGKVWSRALSATEILNNFNSTRGRFGL